MERGATVKAIVVPALGGPENLVLDDLAEPVAGPGELLVDVTAAGVNYVDIYHRRGLYDADPPLHPGQGRGRHGVSGRRGRRGLPDRRQGRVGRRARFLRGTACDTGRSGGAHPGWPRLEDGGRRPAAGSHGPLPGHGHVPAPPRQQVPDPCRRRGRRASPHPDRQDARRRGVHHGGKRRKRPN